MNKQSKKRKKEIPSFYVWLTNDIITDFNILENEDKQLESKIVRYFLGRKHRIPRKASNTIIRELGHYKLVKFKNNKIEF